MMCLSLVLYFAPVIVLTLKVRAQDVYYITSAFTECFPVATAAGSLSDHAAQVTSPTITLISEPDIVGASNPMYPPSLPTDSDGPEGWQPPGIVSYSMPPCAACDCPPCTTTSVFTTMLPDFGSNGPTERPYIVTETYVGLSSLPYFPTPTPIPYGFTTTVATWIDGGAQPITGTIVVPKIGRPLGQDMSESMGLLGTHRPSAAGPVETTLFTQAGSQDSGARHGGASTGGRSTAAPTHVQISAAESSRSECILSYGVVMSALWVVILLQ